MLVPLTGIVVHKLASVLFLLLCIVHAVMFRKQLGWQKFALLGLVLLAFFSGLFGMILNQYPIIMALHKVISMACVFFLAIHIFIFRRRIVSC
ncbi:MAG: heme transporter CcmB [Oscillospiraceae bacterium]|nr:heme transporter CcmB [Oscillospiraceae bacterium]